MDSKKVDRAYFSTTVTLSIDKSLSNTPSCPTIQFYVRSACARSSLVFQPWRPQISIYMAVAPWQCEIYTSDRSNGCQGRTSRNGRVMSPMTLNVRQVFCTMTTVFEIETVFFVLTRFQLQFRHWIQFTVQGEQMLKVMLII